MELEIESRKENPLLEREEFQLSVEHLGEATPSHAKLRKKFAAENDFDTEKLLVEAVKTGFGSGHSKAVIRAYEEPVEDRQTAEPEDSGSEGVADEEEQPEEETADSEQEDTEESEETEERPGAAEGAEESGESEETEEEKEG